MRILLIATSCGIERGSTSDMNLSQMFSDFIYPNPLHQPSVDKHEIILPMEILFALYAFGGLALAGLSVPLILNKVPPNRYYGFPARSILKDSKLWYRVNSYAGRRFMLAGLGTSIGSIILFYVSKPDLNAYAFSCLGLFIALFLWGSFSSFLYLRSIQDKS